MLYDASPLHDMPVADPLKTTLSWGSASWISLLES